jgi:DNA-binding transcriptional regulator PaaX
LKKLILTFFVTDSLLSSHEVVQKLEEGQSIDISVRAVQMALMRYYAQGLLHRERREGRYQYRLSEKGAGRLAWLRKAEG